MALTTGQKIVLGLSVVAVVGATCFVVSRSRRKRGRLGGTEAEDARDRREAAHQKIWGLMRDPDPAAMDVAEDLALEHGIKLREFGRGSGGWTSSSIHGSFVLSPWGKADAPTTRISWAVVPFSQGNGAIGYSTEMSAVADDINVVEWHERTHYMTDFARTSKQGKAERDRLRETATQYAVYDAWRTAKYVKQAQAAGARPKQIAEGISNDISVPLKRERIQRKELYG